jgi:hypothetical protein
VAVVEELDLVLGAEAPAERQQVEVLRRTLESSV